MPDPADSPEAPATPTAAAPDAASDAPEAATTRTDARRPRDPGRLAAGVHARVADADPQRRERRPADHRRPDRDRHLLPDRAVDVPDLGQHRQPARAGGRVHPLRRGGDLRPAAVRDRPLGRLHRCGRRLHHRRADRSAGQPAVVDRDPRRPGGHRRVRRSAGNADHAPGAALVRGHPGRPAVHERRDARTGQRRLLGGRRRDPDRCQQPGRQARQQQHEPGAGLDRARRRSGPVRGRVALPRRPPAVSGPERPTDRDHVCSRSPSPRSAASPSSSSATSTAGR